MMARLSVWLVALWQVLVLLALAFAVGVLQPSRMLFLRPSAWRPVNAWLRAGYFFRFVTGRAAVTFFLVALAAGILVFLVYLLNRAVGWIGMLAWNALGAINYFPHLVGRGQQNTAIALCSAFIAAAVLSVLSRPRRY